MYLYHSKTALKPLWNALTFVLVRFQPQVPYYILGQPQIVINIYYSSNLFSWESCNQGSTDTDGYNIQTEEKAEKSSYDTCPRNSGIDQACRDCLRK